MWTVSEPHTYVFHHILLQILECLFLEGALKRKQHNPGEEGNCVLTDLKAHPAKILQRPTWR